MSKIRKFFFFLFFLVLGGILEQELIWQWRKGFEGANNPELLPKEYTTVIDVAGFLSQGQVCPLLALASSKWV
jgi:hypothetical protein